MSLIVNLVVNIAAVAISSYLLSAHVVVNGWYAAAVTAITLGLLNTFIKPIFTLLTLPLNLITLGLFSVIINGLMIYLASLYVVGFEVENFVWAVIFSIVLSVVNSILGRFAGSS